MTDLKFALLFIGALIICAVLLFNWWQERKIRREASQSFDSPEQDLLMDEFDDSVDKNDKSNLQTSRNEYSQDALTSNHGMLSDARADFEKEMAMHVNEPFISNPFAITSKDDDPSFDGQSDQVTEAASQNASSMHDALHPLNLKNNSENLKPIDFPPEDLAAEVINDSLPDSISHQIDLTSVLYLPGPTRGEKLRDLLLSIVSLDKPVYAFGLGYDDIWYGLTREQEQREFKRAVYSLQLADRSGPVSKETLSRFQQSVDEIGYQLSAQVEWQENPDPLSYAQDLDQFCLDVDKMVGFHLIQGTSGPFTGTKFRGLAEANGLFLGSDGSFHYETNNHERLFTLIDIDNNPFDVDTLRTSVLKGVTFQLDIPRVKNCTEVFNQMVLVARKMETSLFAILVDDKQRPISDPQIEKIRNQLKVIHAQMVARGVVPGSPSALRLFS